MSSSSSRPTLPSHAEPIVVRDGADLAGSNHNETVVVRPRIGGTNHNETLVVRDGADLLGANHNETVIAR